MQKAVKLPEERRCGSAWRYVAAGGLLDVVWAILLKYADGFTVLWPSVFALICIAASYALYILAVASLPIGPAYTVFTGIGTTGTAIIGIVFLGEPANGLRILFLALLMGGMAGLGREERKREPEEDRR